MEVGGASGPSHSEVMTVVVILCLFSVVGVVGNAIAFYIFWMRKPPTTSGIFILALAGTDFFTCLVTIPYTVVFELLRYRLVYDLACKIYFFLVTSTVPFSAYIMVGIALDRYFCICHPFLDAVTIKKARLCIFFLGIPAFFFGVITALNYGTYKVKHQEVANLRERFKMADNSSADELFERTRHFALQQTVGNSGHFTLLDVHVVGSNHSSLTSTHDNASHVAILTWSMYIERCTPNFHCFSPEFHEVYKKVHACGFLISYITVGIIYILIYKSIYTRRVNKARQKKSHLYPLSTRKGKGGGNRGGGNEETTMTVVNGNNETTMISGGCCIGRTPAELSSRDNTAASFMARNDTGVERSPARTKAIDVSVEISTVYIGLPEHNGVPRCPAIIRAVPSQPDSAKDGVAADGGDGCQPTAAVADDENDDLPNKEEPETSTRRTSPTVSPTLTIRSGGSLGKETAEDVNVVEDVKIASGQSSPVVANTKTQESINTDSPCPEEETTCKQDEDVQEQKPLLPKQSHQTASSRSPPDSLNVKSQYSAGSSPVTTPKRVADAAKPHKNTSKTASQKSASKSSGRKGISFRRKRTNGSKDGVLMANIKTAFMLFIVTLVFSIAFMPALLMANDIIPFNLVVFNTYFIYNVANPFIYAFMNQTFREDLKRIIKRCST